MPRAQYDAGWRIDAPSGEPDRGLYARDGGQRGEELVYGPLDVPVIAEERRVGHEVQEQGRGAAEALVVGLDTGRARREMVRGFASEHHQVSDLRGECDHAHAAQDVLDPREALLFARGVQRVDGVGLIRLGLDPFEAALGEPQGLALDDGREGVIAPRGLAETRERRAQQAGREAALERVARLLPNAPERGALVGPVGKAGQGLVQVRLFSRRGVGQEAHGDGETVEDAGDAQASGPLPVDRRLDAGNGRADLVRGAGGVQGCQGVAPPGALLMELDGQPVVQDGHVGRGEQKRVQEPPVAPAVERVHVPEPGELGLEAEQLR